METSKPKTIAAMSGGVDSSVAAVLLREQGHEVLGVTLHLFDNETAGLPQGHTCCSLEDVEDAKLVCQRLGIPHYTFNFKEPFRREVIERFVRTYEAGGTPNPCIDCNRYIKFAALQRRRRELELDYVATGHYARIERSGDRWLLKKGRDPRKDQSYVLYTLTQQELAHTLFPLGELTKAEVREIAREHKLINAAKHDSQDICFVPDGDYGAFLERETGKKYPSGDFLSPEGEKLGTHRGAVRYTLGQRRGLNVSAAHRLYVVGKDMAANTVTLGEEKALYRREFRVNDLNWIAFDRLDGPLACQVKTRYSQSQQPAIVEPVGEGEVLVRCQQPQRAVTVGQAAVFYDGELVLGGGTITR